MLKKWEIMTEIKIGHRTARNRIMMPAMESRLSTVDGSPTQTMIDYYEARAKGGTGIIVVENTFVDAKESRSSLASSGFYSDHHIALKAPLAEAIKDHGALALIQLAHGGRQAEAAATGLTCVAPSAIPSNAVQRMPRELSIPEIEEIEDAFAQAALRAKKAGFDGVEIHGAHGYLISTFLSPLANQRSDIYGGSFENRTRLPRNIIRKIRETVGYDFIVGIKINVDDYIEGGFRPAESTQFIAEVQNDLDYVSCSSGDYEVGYQCQICSTYQPKAKTTYLAKEMKKHVDIPVVALGSLDATLAEETLKNGDADITALGRQLIADPEVANKLAEGRLSDIRPCCRGHEGCISGFEAGFPLRCELNPSVGREKKYTIRKTDDPKKIVVIGGGCAGMEAARVADLMGHSVVLLEKDDKLGGHLNEATVPPFKDRTYEALQWQINQLEKGKAAVVLNTDATVQTVMAYKPDVVIVAVGSKYINPKFIGEDKAIFADEALFNQSSVGKRVIVIGGGLVGCETAMTLKENDPGRDVTIVEMLGEVALNLEGFNAKPAILWRLAEDGVKILTSHKVMEIGDGGIVAENDQGKRVELPADTVIIALGLQARTEEAEQFSDLGAKTVKIGDCVQARRIFDCYEEAWRAVFQA